MCTQGADYNFTLGSQFVYFFLQPGLTRRAVGGTNRDGFLRLFWQQVHQGFQVGGKTGGWARSAKHGAHIVVATAVSQGLTVARHIGRKNNAGVIMIAAQFRKVEVNVQVWVQRTYFGGGICQGIDGSNGSWRAMNQ